MSAMPSARVLICFYTRFGSTAKLAEAVAEGARMVPGDQVTVRRVPDLEPEAVIRQNDRWWRTVESLSKVYRPPEPSDLANADAIILGSPGYFGTMAAALKYWLEDAVGAWHRSEIEEKAGAAFCTTATEHGGNELAILSMHTVLMNLGFVITPAGYLQPLLASNQSPYGAVAVTGPEDDIPPTANDLAAARSLGYRVSHVARCLITGRAQEEYRRRHSFLGSNPPPPAQPSAE